MYIETINGPADVKKLSLEQLPVLAEEMRHALLIRASRHGGHFGPNFGMERMRICMRSITMMFPVTAIRMRASMTFSRWDILQHPSALRADLQKRVI